MAGVSRAGQSTSSEELVAGGEVRNKTMQGYLKAQGRLQGAMF